MSEHVGDADAFWTMHLIGQLQADLSRLVREVCRPGMLEVPKCFPRQQQRVDAAEPRSHASVPVVPQSGGMPVLHAATIQFYMQLASHVDLVELLGHATPGLSHNGLFAGRQRDVLPLPLLLRPHGC